MPLIPPVFTAPGRFLRGNLHTHSTLSDGVLPPGEVCRRYRAEGYDFISLTDHMVGLYDYPLADTRPFRDAGFTTLLGAELHAGAMSNGEIWHVLAVGLPEGFAPPESPDFAPIETQETGPALARRARAAGAFVAIAHPHWSALTFEDAASMEAAHAVEIYNHGCAVGADRGEGFLTAEALLNAGRADLTFIATDDAHFNIPDAFGGWVMVRAEANDPDLILAALKAGHFYSSQGPEFRAIEVGDDSVTVESSAVARVIVQGTGSAAMVETGAALTRTTVPLGPVGDSPWLRVSIADAAGRRAWSNPIFRQ